MQLVTSDLPFLSKRENPPMTLQVGMLGSDGLVLVGDTWQFIEPPGRAWRGHHSSKIRISPDERIAIACAHDMASSFAIAEEIINLRPSGNRRAEIQDIGDRIADGKDSQCLVIFSDPYPSMFRYSHPQNNTSTCEEILACIPIGDEWNMAYYWAMRFHHNGLTCAQLARLGALTVVTAGALSSGSIRGLEGLTCTVNGIRLWQREECQRLEAYTKNLENKIGESILAT
jgi:hypothetical protein